MSKLVRKRTLQFLVLYILFLNLVFINSQSYSRLLLLSANQTNEPSQQNVSVEKQVKGAMLINSGQSLLVDNNKNQASQTNRIIVNSANKKGMENNRLSSPSPFIQSVQTNLATNNIIIDSSSNEKINNANIEIKNNTIKATGHYLAYNQTINYQFIFPQNGGEVRGEITGLCSGPVTGQFAGGEGGKISGKINGSCKIGFFTKTLSIDFDGKVYFSQKKINVNWSGDVPLGDRSGSFEMSF